MTMPVRFSIVLLCFWGIGMGPCVSAMTSAPVPDTTAPDTTAPDTTQAWHEDAWVLVYEQDGVALSYLYYPHAQADQSGVVLRVQNNTDEAICYAFTAIFRPAKRTNEIDPVEGDAEGMVPPHTLRTGESAGLYWVPFEGRVPVSEIGLRGLQVHPVGPAGCG